LPNKEARKLDNLEKSLERLFDMKLPQYTPGKNCSALSPTPTFFRNFKKEIKKSYHQMLHNHTESMHELETHATPMPQKRNRDQAASSTKQN